MTCSKVLLLQGKPYPRTCAEHGLGPCPEPITLSDTPEEAIYASVNQANSEWPVRQDHPPVLGKIIFLPRLQILGVVTNTRSNGAGVMPILSPEGSAYQPGGYAIFVSRDELIRSVIIGDDMLRVVQQYAVRKLAAS